MTYVYLNTYPNGYLYVGSHSWSGNGIDPDYQGSSGIVKRFGWSPCTIKILQVVQDKKLNYEQYWIERFCDMYGIADCAVGAAKSSAW